MALKRSKLTGLNTLAYLGVEPSSPPDLVRYDRSPTTHDYAGFSIGDLWLEEDALSVWLLQRLDENEASWIRIAQGFAWLSYFKTDLGEAYPDESYVNIFGDTSIATSGSGNTITFSLKAGTIGQFYLGGSPIPFLGNLICDDGSITITPAGHNIGIDSTANMVNRLYGDDGFYADPINRYFTVLGSANITVTGGFISAETVQVTLNDDISILGELTITQITPGVVHTDATGLFYADKGNDGEILIGKTGDKAIWASLTSTGLTIDVINGENSIDLKVLGLSKVTNLAGNSGSAYKDLSGSTKIAGSTCITTAAGGGAGDEVEISLTNSISFLGTLTLASLGAGTLVSSATGVFSSLAHGSNGQLLIGRTVGGLPAWASVTSTGGTVTITPGPNTLSFSLSGSSGTMTRIYGTDGNYIIKNPANNVFSYSGFGNLHVTSGGNTVTSLLDPVYLELPNITLSSLSNGAVFVDSIGQLSSDIGSNGQLIIAGSSGPAYSTVTSSDNSVAITGGPGSLALELKEPDYISYAFNYVQAAPGGSSYLGGAGLYSLGQSVALTQVFDDGSNVYAGSGSGAAATFTAPIAGKYFLNLNVQFYSSNNSDLHIDELRLSIVTTKRTYRHSITQNVLIPMYECTRKFSCCADMDAADTATFSVIANLGLGTGTITVNGAAATEPVTWISGYLILKD